METRWKGKLDILSLGIIGLGIYMLMFGSLFISEEGVAYTAINLIGAIMLIGGFTLGFSLQGSLSSQYDSFISASEFYQIVIYVAMSFAGLAIYSHFTHLAFAETIQTTDPIFWAIAEEMAFAYFGMAFFLLLTGGNVLAALIGTATLFTVYHIPRYGITMDVSPFIFSARMILNFAYYKSKRLIVPLGTHIIWNMR